MLLELSSDGIILHSATIKLSKDKCKKEIIAFLKDNSASITKITESSIEFKKKFFNSPDKTIPYKGIVTFAENIGTNITIRYKRTVLVMLYILISISIAFLATLSIYTSLHSQIVFFIILIPFICILLLIPLIYRSELKKDLEDLANDIFNLLNNISEIYEKRSALYEANICPICHHTIPLNSKQCGYCSTEFGECVICKKLIPLIESVFCPYCSVPFHKIEILEWLKVNASCPICKKEIDMWEFQKYLDLQEKLEEITDKIDRKIEKLSPKMCLNCKKHIPRDSVYCIFCGVKMS